MIEHPDTLMPRTRLYGSLCVQRGTPMLQTYADAATVLRHAEVDTLNPDTGTGYQRSLVSTRIAQTAEYYDEKHGRMPNPLLVNIRDKDFRDDVKVEVLHGEDGQLGYEKALESKGNWVGVGFIEFDPDLPMWIYDGQHRKAGLERLIERATGYESFPVPLSLTLGLDTDDEMREFYEVNTNAKAVKVDLAFTLLTKMAESDPEIRELLEVGEKDWIIRGNKVLKVLAEMDGPWRGRFQSANTRKRRGDGVVIPMAQFIRSLKPVLDMPLLKRADPETVASVVNAYWTGISRVLPDPFDGNPEEYVIQKGQGTTALHRVLPQVIEVVRANNDKLGDPTSYSRVLKRLPELSGVTVIDGAQRECSGAEYWEVGSVASGFSGDAGRRRLGMLIQSLLPTPADSLSL